MASREQAEGRVAEPTWDEQPQSRSANFEGVVQSGPIHEPDQNRREQFARELDAKVEAGRLEPREASYSLSRYDNEQLVKMNAEDQRREQGGKLQFYEDKEAPKEQAHAQQPSHDGTAGLAFHEDRHPDQEQTMER